MERNELLQVLEKVKVPLDHPLFFQRLFAFMSKMLRRSKKAANDELYALLTDEYDELSRYLDRSQIQDSCCVRNVIRARKLAQLLIDDKGEVRVALLPNIITLLKRHLYSLGPDRQYDAKRQVHMLQVLETLQQNKEILRFFKKISRPLSNRDAEMLIRDSLQLPENVPLNDALAKRAVLSAWLCHLRQNVGACFATAPAKIVQEEQPEQFIQDLYDLLSTGRLKRVFAGTEYSVPLSPSWGGGDLKKPLFIKGAVDDLKPELWYSPGLIAAFEAVGLLKSEDNSKKKVIQLKEWLMPLLLRYVKVYPIVTAEKIIRDLLLNALQLTEEQIKEYENRPRSPLQSPMMVQTAFASKKNGSIGERAASFLQQFEIAKNAFKALADNALLKAWEYSLASFSDIKQEFARWNLYASLGLGAQEVGGLGYCMYQVIQNKINDYNKVVEDLQYEYEMAFGQVKAIETRMRTASTEKELNWLKIEYQTLTNEFYFLQERRDHASAHAKSLVNLYESLYEIYQELFKDYFQEVYDADMQEVDTGPFDDSPAGFRLVYKHGRSNTSQWTRIRSPQEFVDALAAFFVATEPRLAEGIDIEGMEKEVSEIVTAMINHVKTKEFIETAFHRMARAHQTQPIENPLEHLDKIEKKPWAYTSGGNMNTLVSCYFRLEDKPKEVERWVENEAELFVFLVDTIKQIPPKQMEPFLQGQRRSMLTQSPTHAFTLQPTRPLFKEAWSNHQAAFTYTSVRDLLIRPAQDFVETLMLDEPMMQFLVKMLLEKVPVNFQPRFKSVFGHINGPLTPVFFREFLVDMISQDRGLRMGRMPVLSSDEIDSFLYSQLPLFPTHQLKSRLRSILIQLPDISASKADEIVSFIDEIPSSRGNQLMSARQLQEICLALLCLTGPGTSAAHDYHLHISQAAQKLGFAMPAPILFADTNWVKDEFGFVVNPGTGKFELWRIDYTGRSGAPMSSWKQWLDGSHPNRTWGVYIRPYEYGQV